MMILNSEIFLPKSVCLSKATETSLVYYLTIVRGTGRMRAFRKDISVKWNTNSSCSGFELWTLVRYL